MPLSYQEITDPSSTTFTVSFEFLNLSDIKAVGKLNSASTWTELPVTGAATTSNGVTTVTVADAGTYSSAGAIRLYRASTQNPLVDFQNGSRLSESDLDTAYRQGLFAAQEVRENASENITTVGPAGPAGADGADGADAVGGTNTPAFCVKEGGQQTLQHDTYTNLDFGTEIIDSNNAFTSNKFTVPSGQGGTYYLECQINFYDVQGKLSSGMIAIWKGSNSTKLTNIYNVYTGSEASHLSCSVSTLAVLNAGDVIGAAATITTTDGNSVTSYGGDGGSRIMGFKLA